MMSRDKGIFSVIGDEKTLKKFLMKFKKLGEIKKLVFGGSVWWTELHIVPHQKTKGGFACSEQNGILQLSAKNRWFSII